MQHTWKVCYPLCKESKCRSERAETNRHLANPRCPDPKVPSCCPSCQWVTHLNSTPQARGYMSSSPEPCLQAIWPPDSANTNWQLGTQLPYQPGGAAGDELRRGSIPQRPAHLWQSQCLPTASPVSLHEGHWPRWPGSRGQGFCLRLQEGPCIQGPTEEAHRQGGLKGGVPRAHRNQVIRKLRVGLRGNREHRDCPACTGAREQGRLGWLRATALGFCPLRPCRADTLGA